MRAVVGLAVIGLLPSQVAPAVAAEPPADAALVQQVPPVEKVGRGEPPRPEDYLFSVSGGASRAPYQAGLLYALAAHFRARPPAPAPAAKPAGDLLGFSAVSAGAINAVLAAVSVCMGPAETMSVDDNPLWRFWQGVEWERVFPGDRTCGEYAARFPELGLRCSDQAQSPYSADDGVLTVKGLAPLRRQLLRLFSQRGPLLERCKVPVTLTFTATDDGAGQLAFSLGKLRLRSFRRHTTFEVRTLARGQGEHELRFCRAKGPPASGVAISLPSTEPAAIGECEAIAPAVVADAILASVAAPPLLPPQPVAFCAADCEPSGVAGLFCPAGTRLCQGQLADGAFLDRNPISGAVALQSQGAIDGLDPQGKPPSREHPRRLTHVIVDPVARRGQAEPKAQGERGWTHLRRQIGNFTRVSGDLETQMLARYGRLDHARVSATTRLRELVGDLHVLDDVPVLGGAMRGSAAFFERDFRRFDYYWGIYDGMRWLAEEAAAYCQAHDDRGGCGPKLWGDWLPEIARVVGSEESAGLSFLLGEGKELSPISARAGAGVAEELSKTWQKEISEAKQAAPAVVGGAAALPRRAPDESKRATDQIRKMDAIQAALGAGGGFADFAERLRAAGVYRDPHGDEILPPHIDNYNEWRWRISQQALERLEAIERDAASDGLATGIAVAQYVAAVRASRASLGFDFGPTTVPARLDNGGRTTAVINRLVLPSLLTTDWRHGGLKLGWEWAAYNWQHVRLQFAGAQLQWQRYPVSRAEAWGFGLPSMSFGTKGDNHSLLELGLRATAWYVKDRAGSFFDRVSPGIELYWRPLWGRVELYWGVRDVGCLAGRAAAGTCGDSFMAGLGLGDVGGLLYWITRAVTGSDDTYTQLPARIGSGLSGGVLE